MQISARIHAYNSTENNATGYSPYMLTGERPRIPVDLAFGTSLDQISLTFHRGSSLSKNPKIAYEQAQVASDI